MGETLLSSVLRAGQAPERVAVAESLPERATELREQYGVVTGDIPTVVDTADVVFLAVKPQDISAVLEQCAQELAPDAVIVSVAAGIRIAQLEDALSRPNASSRPMAVIRVMPNTPATVNEGMFVMSPGTSCRPGQIELVRHLLSTAGQVEQVDEEVQDAVTGVSGSGPAYVFYLAEAMAEGGIQAGLSEDTARRLAIQTVVGSAKLMAEGHTSPTELRQRVTSPGGTTAAALNVFDERGMREIIIDAVNAAAHRSMELSGS